MVDVVTLYTTIERSLGVKAFANLSRFLGSSAISLSMFESLLFADTRRFSREPALRLALLAMPLMRSMPSIQPLPNPISLLRMRLPPPVQTLQPDPLFVVPLILTPYLERGEIGGILK